PHGRIFRHADGGGRPSGRHFHHGHRKPLRHQREALPADEERGHFGQCRPFRRGNRQGGPGGGGGFQAGGAEIHHRIRNGGRQEAVFALRRPSGQPGGRRRTSRRNHGHDLRPAGPLSAVRQRQPRENRPPGH